MGFASAPASLTVTVAAPPMMPPADVTGLTATVTANGVRCPWTDIADPMLYDYEIREGTDWASATSLGFFAGTSAMVPPLLAAGYRWMIKARNKLLDESADACVATLGVTAPSQPALTGRRSTARTIVLTWNTPTAMFPIDHYVIAGKGQARPRSRWPTPPSTRAASISPAPRRSGWPRSTSPAIPGPLPWPR